jgi:DNA modification methylase
MMMSEDPRVSIGNGGDVVGEPRESSYAPLPEQKGFFKIPARFGSVPVAEEPLGYDKERRFEHHYPRVELPFQLVDVVKTAAERLGEVTELLPQGRNRLFFGDCLHVMRMLPSESLDLIYIDPPFFSGRNYNIIFGDKNEIRSFSDIWEGGMPGYLIWLNARLYEMKRLLKPTGSIFVHLDWHASHYVKVELDKLFGSENFRNEIVWCYRGGGVPKDQFARKHDVVFWYSKSKNWKFEVDRVRVAYSGASADRLKYTARAFRASGVYEDYRPNELGKHPEDWWEIQPLMPSERTERIGYPTQKPIDLLQRFIEACSDPADTVADFFMGGGSFIAAAAGVRSARTPQGRPALELHPTRARRWIGCDISRVAVALTADRVARLLAPTFREAKRMVKTSTDTGQEGLFEQIVQTPTLTSVEDGKKKAVASSLMPLTGYCVEHWGIYEINRLTRLSADEFRAFVLACYGARKWTGSDPNIHGVKGKELVWVGGPKETDVLTPTDVKNFAQAVLRTRKPEERLAVMIGWSIDPKARAYAEQVMALGEQKPIQFIKLRLWPLAGEELKAHITKKHDKYKDFFAFILPPDIPRIGETRLSPLKYRFDVSEARSMNTGGRIVNVQWDFDFRDGIFSATQGYQLCRRERKGGREGAFEGEMTVEYTFEDVEPGTNVTIACRVQDDLGGEGMRGKTLRVE